MTMPMLTRFEGDGGRQCLVAAIRLQQIVGDDEAIAAEIAEVAELLVFGAATTESVVIRQGASDNDIFLLVTGRVSVQINGREVATRTPGQHVGEMALIDPRAARSATVIATEPTILAKITEPAFSKLAHKYPQLWRRLALELADRLRQRGRFLTPPNEKPAVFIGSSAETLAVARQIQSALAHDPMLVSVWTDGVFRASRAAVESLLEAVRKSDFAVLVLAPEDTVISREVEKMAPRDNCIFELGLFMGALGRERVFIAKPRGEDIKMPSDLLGITPLEYAPGTPDSLPARIAPICTEIRQAVVRLGPK